MSSRPSCFFARTVLYYFCVHTAGARAPCPVPCARAPYPPGAQLPVCTPGTLWFFLPLPPLTTESPTTTLLSDTMAL